jgi:hypothetical protein
VRGSRRRKRRSHTEDRGTSSDSVRAGRTAEKNFNTLGVEDALKTVLRPTEVKEFGSQARGLFGISNRPDGVQWSAWYDTKRDVAELAANLEGIEHDDWPVGRLIDRELETLSLFKVCRRYRPSDDVRAVVKKDAWMTWKMRITDAVLLEGQCYSVTEDDWTRAFRAARALLGPEGRGRGRAVAVLSQKGAREMEVSPHVQFIAPLWARMPSDHTLRVAAFRRALTALAPLHAAMTELAQP